MIINTRVEINDGLFMITINDLIIFHDKFELDEHGVWFMRNERKTNFIKYENIIKMN